MQQRQSVSLHLSFYINGRSFVHSVKEKLPQDCSDLMAQDTKEDSRTKLAMRAKEVGAKMKTLGY